MKAHVRLLVPIVIAATAAPLASGEEYQCKRADGCVAYHYSESGVKKVTFARGDVVSAAAGWVVNPGDGWVAVN
jgi:hypothetical protein